MYKEILTFKNSRQAFFELSCARLSELYNAASLFKGWSQIPINPEKIHKRVKKHEIFPVLIVVRLRLFRTPFYRKTVTLKIDD